MTNCNYENNCCLPSTDINTSLRATLKFIQSNQIDSNGELIYSTFILGVSLLSSQGTAFPSPRELVSTIITGYISDVGATYVKVVAPSPCKTKFEEYPLAYSDISTISSNILIFHFDLYEEYMSKLPKVCTYSNDPYFNILSSLKSTISKNLNSNKIINVVYSGVSSLDYAPSSYKTIKNLVCINNFYVIPITQISAFFLKEGV